MGVGATWFGIRRTLFAMGAGGTVESIVLFEMEGECTRLSETWSEEEYLISVWRQTCLLKLGLSS